MTLKKKVHNFFKKVAINIIRSRRQQAAQYVAYHLIHSNKDFRNASPIDLTQRIMKGSTTDQILSAIK